MGKAKREHKTRVIAGLEPPIHHEKVKAKQWRWRVPKATMTRDEILALRRPISKREVV